MSDDGVVSDERAKLCIPTRPAEVTIGRVGFFCIPRRLGNKNGLGAETGEPVGGSGRKRDVAGATSRKIRDARSLRSGADRLHCRGVRECSRACDEEVVIVHVAIDASSNFGGFRTEGWTSPLQEDDNHDAPYTGVGVRGKPAIAGSRV